MLNKLNQPGALKAFNELRVGYEERYKEWVRAQEFSLAAVELADLAAFTKLQDLYFNQRFEEFVRHLENMDTSPREYAMEMYEKHGVLDLEP